jgi:hypothetical protein
MVMPQIEDETTLKKAIADSQAALEQAKAKLAEFQAAGKADEVFVKLRDSYDKAQFDIEATDDALRENQAEEQGKLEALLQEKAADVDAAVEAARKVVADREDEVADAKDALADQQDAVAAAKAAQADAKAEGDRLNNAVKLIQAKHKLADSYRLQAAAARKAGNPAFAYYLVKELMTEALDGPPEVLETDDYEQAVRAAAEKQTAAAADVAGAEKALTAKRDALAEAEKKLAAAVKDLPGKIEEALADIEPPAVPAVPAPPPAAPAPAPQSKPKPKPEPEPEQEPENPV